MKTIVYISYDFFLDVDYPILPELSKQYELFWIVFTKFSLTPRFTYQEIKEFALKHSILLEIYEINTRFRNPKQLVEKFKFTLWLKKLNADFYYFNSFADPYLPVLVKLFLKKKKVVVAIHDVANHQNTNSISRRLFNAFCFSVFKNYHIFSLHQKEIFLKNHPKKNILLARLCLKDFGPSKINKTNTKINFLFFGVIQYYKGVDCLIRATNLLAQDFKNFTVTIAGYCDDFSSYQNLIQNPSFFKLNINVVPSNEIATLFKNADFLVLPYRDVSQSGPLKIAYNYNIPVIASNFPGFNEYIINGVNGYLFEPNNSNALYEVMKSVLCQTSEETDKIKSNLKEFVEQELKLENIIAKYIGFFETL
jgi:glycosyltransferase involved in cell wall biosynthesis